MEQPPKKQNGSPGRKPANTSGARVPIGISRVAPDVAERIAAEADRVAFIEALVRAARPSTPPSPHISSVRVPPTIPEAQRELITRYQAGGYQLRDLATVLKVSTYMLGRELLGIRIMPPKRVTALKKLLNKRSAALG